MEEDCEACAATHRRRQSTPYTAAGWERGETSPDFFPFFFFFCLERIFESVRYEQTYHTDFSKHLLWLTRGLSASTKSSLGDRPGAYDIPQAL